MTGSGTKDDPYIINSTEDFLFMSKKTFSSKYIELACDIELNDETFDENGQASGGDGNVYSWQSIAKWHNCYFNGNGNTIKNYYYNTSTGTASLFSCTISKIENLNVKGMYLKAGSKAYGVSISANIFENVHNLGGYISAPTYATGIGGGGISATDCSNRATISQPENSTIKGDFCGVGTIENLYNCVNYGKITSNYSGYMGGITTRGYGEIDNCRNYGEVSFVGSSSTGVGGLIGYVDLAIVTNCVNYANVTSGSGICGYIYRYSTFDNCKNYGECFTGSGLVGWGYGIKMTNCINYGKIYNRSGLMNALHEVRGAKAESQIMNCKNYGDIVFTKSSQIAGFLLCQVAKGSCEIINCGNYGNISGDLYGWFGFVGMFQNNTTCYMKNIVHKAKYNDFTGTTYLFGYNIERNNSVVVDGMTVDVENVNIQLCNTVNKNSNLSIKNANIKCKSYSSPFKLLNTANNVTLKNIIIENACPFAYKEYHLITGQGGNLNVDGLLYTMNYNDIGLRKRYIGTNFKSFFADWQTGRIGLKTMEAVGSFYATVDEDVLDYYQYQEGALNKS